MLYTIILIIFFLGLNFLLLSFLYNIVKKLTKNIIYPTTVGTDFIKTSFAKTINKTRVPLIKLEIAGKKYNFLIDSGATTNIIEEKILEEIGNEVKQVGKRALSGISGDVGDRVEVSLEFKHKKKSFKGNFLILDQISASFDQIDSDELRPVGLIGSNFLMKYNWQIDYDLCIIWIPIEY